MRHGADSTVFVVEDDQETRSSFAALVSSMGLPVETFAGAEEFLAGLETSRPGCALVDFRLRGMDGVALHKHLVDAGIHLPVILISAHLNVRAAAGALQEGVFRVLEKPYHDDELANAIQEALKWDRTLRERSLHRSEVEQRLQSLDAREQLVLELILAGQPNKAIERRLGLSRRTVERIRSAILEKMETLSFVELSAIVAEARTSGGKDSRRPSSEACGPSSPVSSADATQASLRESLARHERDWTLLRCDLHDGAAQYVSAVILRLQALDAQRAIPAEAQPLLREAMTLLSMTLRDIRDIIAARPLASSRQLGFLPSLNSLIRELVGSSGVEVELVESLDGDDLDALLQTAIHRFVQEGLNNAIRHSGSQRVRVEIAKRSEVVRLEVRDWGVGFDPQAVTVDHRGLQGMRERAELLGGRAAIQTKPEWGTLVAVELPWR